MGTFDMMYRRVEYVQAIQWLDGMDMSDLMKWEQDVGGVAYLTDRSRTSVFLPEPAVYPDAETEAYRGAEGAVLVATVSGEWDRARRNDWILNDSSGYFSVCGPERFERLYSLVTKAARDEATVIDMAANPDVLTGMEFMGVF